MDETVRIMYGNKCMCVICVNNIMSLVFKCQAFKILELAILVLTWSYHIL